MAEKIVYLRWLDSALTSEWSHAPSDDTGLSEIETVGYLILEDDKHVQVAQSNWEDYKYGAILAIPKSVILERRIIHLKKPKKGIRKWMKK